MKKLVIVANRLPLTIKSVEPLELSKSPGGLVSGLETFIKKANIKNYLWIGWAGAGISKKEVEKIRSSLVKKQKCLPIHIPTKLFDKFYNGFCNKTLWPLFHSLLSLAIYDETYWESYVEVNRIFLHCLAKEVSFSEDTYIWVHDYHLMLLPHLLREKYPTAKVGFFLHIPFPPLEIFAHLPWRKEILDGLLGADLIGFHTYEYTVNFLRSVSKIIGVEHFMGELSYSNRVIKVDTFPLGVDFELFNSTPSADKKALKIRKALDNKKIIFSVDRLDYTKGIYNRLLAFEDFITRRTEWKGKVVFILNIVPSREGVEHYQRMRREIEEKVSEINGKFGSIEWVPILYHYRSLSREELIAHYRASDVILVTPIKDGMNLISKEFVASRKDLRGVIVLSEFAGSSKELGEAILVNPNSIDELSKAIENALEMPEEEQENRLKIMQERLRRYNVLKWGTEFMESLAKTIEKRNVLKTKEINNTLLEEIISKFKKASKKLLLIDYDGTLVPITKKPNLATPTVEVKNILSELGTKANVTLALISGRKKEELESWFGNLPIYLIGEHGRWIKKPLNEWEIKCHVPQEIKDRIKDIMELYVDRLPQSFIEEKGFTIAFHYRNSDPEMASLRVTELVEELSALTANTELSILMGNKVIEVRPAGINKGTIALTLCQDCDFILAMGDDVTDEDMFKALPLEAITIKVGIAPSFAKYNVPSYKEALTLLKRLAEDG
ncbi:MAG: trehalose 6-phosphate synthase/phosphatase [bacterium]|nr:trehalose 6-phosphate synthase/phosphatase [bacterium]